MSQKQVEYSYVRPNDHVFMDKEVIDNSQIIPEGTMVHILSHLEYPESGGILSFYQGVKYPRKSFPFPQAAEANDKAKKISMFFVSVFSDKVFIIPILAFAVLPWKIKIRGLEKILRSYFNAAAGWIIARFFYKDERYCDTCRELMSLVKGFLKNIGISEETSHNIAKAFAHMIQFDDAYRYRLEDVFDCLTRVEIIENPRKAIKKAVAIFAQREEDKRVAGTIESFARILSVVFLVPRIKKAFLSSFEKIDFSKLQYDEADRYHTLLWQGYDYQGMKSEQRLDIYANHHSISNCCKADIDVVDNCDICVSCKKKCEIEFNYPPVLQLVKKKK